MSLPDAIANALVAGKKLRAPGAKNEANTKALIIEPLLAALGWDPADLDVVAREVKVYDGTFLDYGLKVEGEPRLYVEAKAIGENLTDKKFVAQTINYANNDGVVWCVLTDGIVWRVFKTNETAAMDRKLLFEIDISNQTQPTADIAKLLRLVSQESVASRSLDGYGERVFTDGRVRAALASIALDPPPALNDAVNAFLGHPPVDADTLQRSLARIFDASPSSAAAGTTGHPASGAASSGRAAPGPPQPPMPAKGQQYPLEHHLANKSALITELFNEINGFAMALGADVTRRVRKQYIGYFRGKRSFLTVELQKQRVLIYLNLTVETAEPWNTSTMRDVTKVGHFGMGDIEYSLATIEQLDEATSLAKIAHATSQ